jgi:hypothetical protein
VIEHLLAEVRAGTRVVVLRREHLSRPRRRGRLGRGLSRIERSRVDAPGCVGAGVAFDADVVRVTTEEEEWKEERRGPSHRDAAS